VAAVVRRFGSAFLWLLASASLYLYILNRRLIQARDGPYKSPGIRIGALVTGAAAAFAGYCTAGSRWLAAPVAVLAVAAAGEVRRWRLRRHSRGAPPVHEENARVALSRPDTTTDLALRRYELPVAGWQGPRLRIAHVSDFHLNSHLPLAYFESAMRQVAAQEPDLLFITGDFVSYPEYAPLLPGILGLARGRYGTFAVLGNHDDWAGAEIVADAVRSAGVHLLGNGSTRMEVSGRPVLIAGCELPWTRAAWQPAAPAPGELALMLTHTPDNVFRLSGRGYAAIFAGHYHGGQMRLPLLGSLVVPSNYGRRFDHGRFVINGTHLFVTAGIGSAEPPMRLWCQPDVLLVDVLPERT
jgi:predicted MPP superfamily phosphohydrolase